MPLRPVCYTAHWVIPVASPPIAGGAVLVDDRGRIAAVGPQADVAVPPDAERVELGEAALLPGLVNSHSHPELAGLRGLLEDLPFREWIPALNRAKRAAALTDEEYGAAARWTCAESLAAGITAMGATEDSGAALDALVESGLRGVVFREVFGPAPEQALPAIRDLAAKVEAMRARETELVRVGVSPHAPYTVSDDLYREVARFARAESLSVACHAAEAQVEEELIRAGTGSFAEGLRARGIDTPPRGRSTIALLETHGILELRPLLIHCVRVDAEDIARIAAHGAAVAHCPIANARLGHGIAPVPEMIDAGVTVGLGSDSVASNNRIDVLEEARLAQILQRARAQSADVLSSERLLRMATIEGARALRLDDRIGTLEPGKDADLCAVSLAGVHTRPVHEPLAALFHTARAPDVMLTAVRGRVLYRSGSWTTIDVATVRRSVESAAVRLRAARDAS